MHLRPLVPMGLALLASTGCQSYFPYGYGNSSPYPPMSGAYPSSGTTSPSRTAPSETSPSGSSGQFPTPANGPRNLNSGSNGGATSRGRVPDPRFATPGTPPTNLGAPASEEEQDSIRGGRSSLDGPRKQIDDFGDEADESLSSLDEEKFVSPTPYRAASATSDDPDARRPAPKTGPSPYKYDAQGYTYLRGIVSHDAKTNSWRITYSRDPLDKDPYGGSLTLVDDPILDTLMDDDVVLAEGRVDRSVLDRYGKPSYRASRVRPLKPRED